MVDKGKKTTRDLPKNIRERNGKFSYRYYVPVTEIVDGKEKKSSKETESPLFDTQEEAENFGILIKAEKINKTLKYESNMTVKFFSHIWLKEYIIEREPANNTIKGRKAGLVHICREFGAFALRDVTEGGYQSFLYKLKEKGLSKSTITSVHTAGSLMFKHAKRKGLIKADPTLGARIPKDKREKRKPGEKRQIIPQFLERYQLAKFIEVSKFTLNINSWAVFLVMAYTGLRVAEAAGLQWEDIDTENRTIDINKQLEKSSIKNYSFGPTKNEQSERVVHYGSTIAKALESLKSWQKKEKLSAKKFNPKDNFVFWSPNNPGYPFQITNLGATMRRSLKAADLPTNLTPHSLRHTHVSLLASNPNVGLTEIQARIGHKPNSKVTALIYLHVTQEKQRRMGDDFEWAMNN